jgi:hypothetical protein
MFIAALLAAGALSSVHGQVPLRGRTIAGVAYTIRVTGSPASGSGIAGAFAEPAKSYAASAIFAAGRGRLDITDGGIEPLFQKGDYVLFDSTGLLIVHPAAHEFLLVPPDAGPNLDQLESMGVKVSLFDLKVTIDSLPAVDTVAGYPTRHFRLTTAYNMSVEAAGMQQRLATEAITDYWVAAVPGLPGNPFLRANGFSSSPIPTGIFRDLSTRIDSAAARMGSRVALRTTTSSRLLQGPGSAVQMRQTSEVADIRPREVDTYLLILPPGYRQGAVPGTDAQPATPGDPAAKWRRLPAMPGPDARSKPAGAGMHEGVSLQADPFAFSNFQASRTTRTERSPRTPA